MPKDYKIPPEQFIPFKGTRKFVKSRQCATVFKNGRRAGMRCNWYALKDSDKCIRHQGAKGVSLPKSPEFLAKLHRGRDLYYERIRKLEAEFPGVTRKSFGLEMRERIAEIRKEMPKPKTKDPMILKADRAIVQDLATLPAVPDKPFEEMEPHEQLTVITGQSLKVVHEILSFPTKDKDGVVDLKAASLVKDTALRALAVRVKVDRNALAARRLDKIGDLLARLKGDTPAAAGKAQITLEGSAERTAE